MSRSYRKPVEKVKRPQEPRHYNKMAKSRWRQITRSIIGMTDDDIDLIDYPNINAIYDMWSFEDYKLIFINSPEADKGDWHSNWIQRIKRK